MKKLILLIALIVLPWFGLAEDEVPIALEHAKVNVHDQASIERGAKFFAKNCLLCHTMKYLRYDKVATSAGITWEKMPLKNQQWLFGIVPPDLSLAAARRGPDWLYTYFHSFYQDPKRLTGFNNLVFKDSNMTNIFVVFQGVQQLVPEYQPDSAKFALRRPHYYSVLELVKSGSMSPEEFDQVTTDLVNFLVYASDPYRVERERLGYWVIGFLLILLCFSYLLYREYWRNIH